MMVAVHALTGAVLGRLCRSRGQAVLVGLASHAAGDLLPHRDLAPPQEAALAVGALTLVGLVCGPGSREFAGAVGAALPDVENGVARLLDIPESKMLWPTHRGCHGRRTEGIASQVALAAICAAVIAVPSNGLDHHGG